MEDEQTDDVRIPMWLLKLTAASLAALTGLGIAGVTVLVGMKVSLAELTANADRALEMSEARQEEINILRSQLRDLERALDRGEFGEPTE